MPILGERNLSDAVIHHIAIGARFTDAGRIADVSGDERHVGRPIFGVRHIEDAHGLPMRLQPVAQQRTKISRAARDQNICLIHNNRSAFKI